MAWPEPGSGLPLVVPLPWSTREPNVRPMWARETPAAHRRAALVVQQSSDARRAGSIRKAKYGAAMLGGLLAVALAKRIINSIPFVNVVTRPLLALFPTVVAGPALGAALMYGNERGDLLAARELVRDKAALARQELNTVVQDLSAEARARNAELAYQLERSQGALDHAARVTARSVADLERRVVPVLEREYRAVETQARKAFEDGSRGTSGAGGAPRTA